MNEGNELSKMKIKNYILIFFYVLIDLIQCSVACNNTKELRCKNKKMIYPFRMDRFSEGMELSVSKDHPTNVGFMKDVTKPCGRDPNYEWRLLIYFSFLVRPLV